MFLKTEFLLGCQKDGRHQGPLQGRRHEQERQPATNGSAQSTGKTDRSYIDRNIFI